MDAREEAVLRTLRLFDAGDVEAAFAATTDDVVVDQTASNAPWRGISRGKAECIQSLREWRAEFEDLGGVAWKLGRTRSVAGGVVAETGIAGQGPASGLPIAATAAWDMRFAGELVSRATLYQSYEEALLGARRAALGRARLYFVCDGQPQGQDPSALLAAAIRGGVDMIQLREKAPRCAEELIAFAEPFARAAREHGALFWLNDEPRLVEQCGADGVHVGQDDAAVADARAVAGSAALVGLSTHSADQFDAAIEATGAGRPDQISAGPVWETPTKVGRPATGLGLIEHAAARTADAAWFAIGGIDADTVGDVAAAGARRAVVVRAIRDADDPEAAARHLRAALAD